MRILFVAAVAIALAPSAHAQSATGRAAQPASAAAAAPATEGEVRKVDKEQGKLTLRHGAITNLDMPAMTMVFRVANPRMLDGVKEGDKVKFSVERLNGAFTVTAIEAAK